MGRIKHIFSIKKISVISIIALVIGIVLCYFSCGNTRIYIDDNYANVESEEKNINIETVPESTIDHLAIDDSLENIEVNNDIQETIEETEDASNFEEEIQIELVSYFTSEEIIMVAQTLWAECRGITNTTEKACVVWTIVNRVDAGDSDTISGVLRKPHQFAWRSDLSYTDELYDLAEDVLMRWNLEKNGYSDVGRVLPKDYLWFRGDGNHNYFRNQYEGNFDIWDYSLPSPYDD